MHIGLIGGIGPAATAYYYRGLSKASAAINHPMELTIAHAQIKSLMENMTTNSPLIQAQVFAKLTQQLKNAGADQLAVTSLAGHFCINQLKAISPLPIINAIPAIADELNKQTCLRVGLLGTKLVMHSGLYQGLTDFDLVLPEGDNLGLVHQAYMGMAMAGECSEQQRDTLFSIGQNLCTKQGADIVLLGGTDLFLAFAGYDCGFPVMDSADVHIHTIHQAMIDNCLGKT